MGIKEAELFLSKGNFSCFHLHHIHPGFQRKMDPCNIGSLPGEGDSLMAQAVFPDRVFGGQVDRNPLETCGLSQKQMASVRANLEAALLNCCHRPCRRLSSSTGRTRGPGGGCLDGVHSFRSVGAPCPACARLRIVQLIAARSAGVWMWVARGWEQQPQHYHLLHPQQQEQSAPHTEDHMNLATVILHWMAKFDVACSTEKPSAGPRPFPGPVLLFGDNPLLKPGSLQERPRKAQLAVMQKFFPLLGSSVQLESSELVNDSYRHTKRTALRSYTHPSCLSFSRQCHMLIKRQTFIFCLQIHPILGEEGCEPDGGSLMFLSRLGPTGLSGYLKGVGVAIYLIIGADMQPPWDTSCAQESYLMRHHVSRVVLLLLTGEGSWASKDPTHFLCLEEISPRH